MQHFRRKRRISRRHRLLARLALLLAALLAVFILLNIQVTPVFSAYAATVGHTLGVRQLNDAVGKVLDESGATADTLMNYQKNDAGQIVAVQANTAQINDLKRKVINEATSRLSTLRDSDIRVPLGTILGGALFAGQGPPVRLRFSPVATVDADIHSTFTSAGINQTRQTITLTVRFDLFMILMGRQATAHVQNDYMVAESVIVGTVPNSYFQTGDASGNGLAGYAYSSNASGTGK